MFDRRNFLIRTQQDATDHNVNRLQRLHVLSIRSQSPLDWNTHWRPVGWHLLRQAPTCKTSHIRQINWHKKKTTLAHHYVSELWNEPHHNLPRVRWVTVFRILQDAWKVAHIDCATRNRIFLCLGSTALVGLSFPLRVSLIILIHTTRLYSPGWVIVPSKRPLTDNKESQEDPQSLHACGLRQRGYRVRHLD